MYLTAVCNVVTSLWYCPHEVVRTRLRYNNFPGQRKYHSLCQMLFNVWNKKEGRGLCVVMTVLPVRVMLNYAKQEPMGLTTWPIMGITRPIWPSCEGPRGRCLNPKGVYTVHLFYHGVKRILENCAGLAGGCRCQDVWR